ncbi:MAG: hypothetical protein H6709_08010 [Kofleriaceae bacterium]|nr:hypothetical protein [Kofleriaceae bacterium]
MHPVHPPSPVARRFAGRLFGLGILLALAACGEVSSFVDASTGGDDTVDASTAPDAAPDAIAAGTVNVTTYTRCCTTAGIQAGVQVFAVDADGTPGDSGTTDLNGELSLDVTAGSSVTAVYLDQNGNGRLFTFAAVMPGDSLQFGDHFDPGGASTQIATMTVNFPTVAGANYYYITGPCGTYYANSSQTQVVMNIYNYCAPGPTTFVFQALDNNGNTLRWNQLTNVPVQTTTIGINNWQNPGSFSVSITGLPPVVTNVSTQNSTTVNGNYRVPAASVSGTPTGGNLSGTVPWVPIGSAVRSDIYFNRDGNFSNQWMARKQAAGATSLNVANPTLLPWIGQTVVDTTTRQLVWIQDGDGGYDATIIGLYYYRQAALYGVVGTNFSWNLVLPPGVTSVRLPNAPSALTPYLPQEGDGSYGSVALIKSDDFATYRDVIALPEWLLFDIANRYIPEDLPEPANLQVSGYAGGA